MMKSQQLAPDTIGSKFLAWQPNLGLFDIRWAAELPPFGKLIKTTKSYDKDLDTKYTEDLDERYVL